MEPKIVTPFYKWFIISVSGALVGIVTILFIMIMSESNNRAAEDAAAEIFPQLWQSPAAADSPTKRLPDSNAEIRGIWIASVENIDFPSKPGLGADLLKAELDDILNTALESKLNTIYFQVRPASDALYNSSVFPVSKYLTETQGGVFPDGFDPLAYLIEIAHKEDVKVHAWVNPLRITAGSAGAPQHDVNALAKTNPARKHPEWTVPYADGRLYYDAGLPQVRALIADGVAEIVMKYEIDGVVFDDYFYPYPVKNAVFDDDASYQIYGTAFGSKGDWRRDNVNKMVEDCYKAVKNVRTDCKFGIAPFGIWQNDNGKNGGSDTSGLNSYSEIYCDALAWIKGGYIDYIAPQIYWSFSAPAARYDVLVRWWNGQLDGYPDVGLIICHAMHRSAEWNIANEIKNQIEYARSEKSYIGSILYGYSALKRDDMDLKRQLREVYKYDYSHPEIKSDGAELSVSSPGNGAYINYDSTYIIGKSDPSFPLTFGGKPVSRTKNGYFSLFVPLNKGKNTFAFNYKGEDILYYVNRGYAPAGETAYGKMDSYKITDYSPVSGYLVPAGTVIEVSVTAPSKSTVTAKLGNETVTLKPQILPPDSGDYMVEKYTGKIAVPDRADSGAIVNLNEIVFTAVRGNEKASATGANVRAAGSGAYIAVEVTRNDTELKVGENSWYYDDYTPASKGMRDYAYSLKNGFYKLRMGGYLTASGVKELGRTEIPVAKMTGAYMTVNEKETSFFIKTNENVPLNGYVQDGKFIFTLYNVDTSTGKEIKLLENPMISEIKRETYSKTNAYRYICKLKSADNFYGFEFSYADGHVVVSLKNPRKLPNSPVPLTGKTIYIDAGHGGSDAGATGPDNTYNEADMNLDVAKAAAAELEKLGAKVVVTREEDVTVDIYKRLDTLIALAPDLCISLHQNSMAYNSDITRIRGLIGLYFADSGLLLTKCVSAAVAEEMNRLERNATQQRLAMVRNPKFPSTLIEVSFITCVEEYEMMRRGNTIERVGKAVAKGVLDFYRAQEKFLK